MTSVKVIGVGNVLTGDDALGPTAVRLLEAEWELPESVEVLDAGTPGMDLITLMGDADAVIVVDTVLGDGPAGTVKTYDRDVLLGRPLTPRVNPHAPGLAESLYTLELAGTPPDRVRLIGVVPGATEVGVGLSEALTDVLPEVLDTIVRTLGEWGVYPVRRERPDTPDLWWKAAERGAFVPGSGAV